MNTLSQHTTSPVPSLHLEAASEVQAAIASIGRTEDICFSPRRDRLAIAAFHRERILLLDVAFAATAEGKVVRITGATELISPALQRPHGVAFLDDGLLCVANRGNGVSIFRLPGSASGYRQQHVEPMLTVPAGEGQLLRVPGSLACLQRSPAEREMLVCNNATNVVSRHLLSAGDSPSVLQQSAYIRKWIDLPDGIALSRNGRWLAISNHEAHCVLLYDRSRDLTPDSDPSGILRRVYYPHGMRFSEDGDALFVTDAGWPVVHTYRSADGDWCGVRNPEASTRIMSEEVFAKGNTNPEEGGPKGIDLNDAAEVLVVTSHHLPLAFFDLCHFTSKPRTEASQAQELHASAASDAELRYELHVLAHQEGRIKHLKDSKSWRITAPLRAIGTLARRASR